MKYNPETKKVELEDPETEMNKRMEFYSKKKGIYHLHEAVLDKMGKLEAAMKEARVSWDDVMQNRAPENVLNLKQELDLAKIREVGVREYHLKNESEYGKTKDLAKELEHEVESEVKTKAEQEAIEAAELKYQMNPSPANARDLIKLKHINKIGGATGVWDNIEAKQHEEINDMNEKIRQQYAAENAEKEKAEIEMYQDMLKNKHDPEGQRIAALQLKGIVRKRDNAEEAEKIFAQEEMNEKI